MNWKISLVFILGLAGLVAFLYWGLNTTERGICELLAIKSTAAQAFSCDFREKGIHICFAGRAYYLGCQQVLEFFSSLIFRRN